MGSKARTRLQYGHNINCKYNIKIVAIVMSKKSLIDNFTGVSCFFKRGDSRTIVTKTDGNA